MKIPQKKRFYGNLCSIKTDTLRNLYLHQKILIFQQRNDDRHIAFLQNGENEAAGKTSLLILLVQLRLSGVGMAKLNRTIFNTCYHGIIELAEEWYGSIRTGPDL